MTEPISEPISIAALDALVRPARILWDLLPLLPVDGVVHAWRVVRSLSIWLSSEVDDRIGLFNDGAMERLEVEILLAGYDDALRLPLAVIIGSLRSVGSVIGAENRLAYACMCAAEWASSRRSLHVMAGFAAAGAAAAGTERYRLIAELAGVGLALAELPVGDKEGQRSVLEALHRRIVRRISELGGSVTARY